MRQVLRLVHSEDAPDPPRIIFGSALVRRLVERAATLTGSSCAAITGPRRTRDLVWTRAAIALVARERHRTYPQIGDILRRDHSSIIGNVRLARTLDDPDFVELVDLLREEAGR